MLRISRKWIVILILLPTTLVATVRMFADSVSTGVTFKGGDFILIPGGPPEVVAPKLEEAKAKVQAKIQPMLDQLRNEAATRFNNWYGTVAVVADSVDKADQERCQTIADYLTGEITVPEERAVEFAEFLNRGKFRCVRWDVAVLSAKSDGDAWEATIRVRPWLAKISGLPVYTPQSTLETWRIEKDGRATPLKVEVDEPLKRGIIFED